LVSAPGRVEVALADARVTSLDGTELATRQVLPGTVFQASEPGLYTAQTAARRVRIAVNLLDRELTEVNRSGLAPRVPGAAALSLDPLAPAREGWREELWLYLLLAAFLLAALEWWAYHRRLTV
jgi:hypothetical protein